MKYTAEIKEVGNPSVLKPSLSIPNEMTNDQLVKFWGLDQPDVEWYKLYKVVDGQIVELLP